MNTTRSPVEVIREYPLPDPGLCRLLFSSDDALIAAVLCNGTQIAILDADSGRVKWTLHLSNPIDRVLDLSFAPGNGDHRLVFVTEKTPGARIFDPSAGRITHCLINTQKARYKAVCWSDNDVIVAASKTGFDLWHPSGTRLRTAPFPEDSDLDDNPQLSVLLPGGGMCAYKNSRRVHIFDVATGTTIYDRRDTDLDSFLMVSPDLAKVAYSRQYVVRVDDIETGGSGSRAGVSGGGGGGGGGKDLCSLEDLKIHLQVFSPDSRFLASARIGLQIHSVDGDNFPGRLLFTSQQQGQHGAMVFSHAGDTILVGCSTDCLHLYAFPIGNRLVDDVTATTQSAIIPFGKLILPPANRDDRKLQETLEWVQVFIDRADTPDAFHQLVRILHHIGSIHSEISGLVDHAILLAEIEASFAEIVSIDEQLQTGRVASVNNVQEQPSHTDSLASKISSTLEMIKVITSLSSTASPSSASVFKEIDILHSLPRLLSRAELDSILDFACNTSIELRSLEGSLAYRADMLSKAIVEFDTVADSIREEAESSVRSFASLLAHLKEHRSDQAAKDHPTEKTHAEIISLAAAGKEQILKEQNQGGPDDDSVTWQAGEKRRQLQLIARVEIKGHAHADDEEIFLSPENDMIAVLRKACIQVYDLYSGNIISQINFGSNSIKRSRVAFSPEMKQVIVGDCIFQVSSGDQILTLSGFTGDLCCVAWSSTDVIAVGSTKGHIHLFRSDGTLFNTLSGPKGQVKIIGFNPGGTLLAANSGDHTFRIWDTRSSASIASVSSLNVQHISFSPDGTKVALVSNDRRLFVLDPMNGGVYGRVESKVNGISWSPNSLFLLAALEMKWIMAFTAAVKADKVSKQIWEERLYATALAFSADGGELWTFDCVRGHVSRWRMHNLDTVVLRKRVGVQSGSASAASSTFSSASLSLFATATKVSAVERGAQAAQHAFDRVTTVMNRIEYPDAFRQLVKLAHGLDNAAFAVVYKKHCNEDDADDDQPLQPSLPMPVPEVQQVLDFIHRSSIMLSRAQRAVFATAADFAEALMAYDKFVDSIRDQSEKSVQSLKEFVSFLSQCSSDVLSDERLQEIESCVIQIHKAHAISGSA